jgi:hypothetical protein
MESLIKDAIDYWDKHEYSREILKNTSSRYVTEQSELNPVLLIGVYKDSNISFKSECQMVANITSIGDKYLWIWYWALPNTNVNQIDIALKIMKYGLSLRNVDEYPLKNILINSRFLIGHSYNLIITYAALISYINKNPYVVVLSSEEEDYHIVVCYTYKDEIEEYINKVKEYDKNKN